MVQEMEHAMIASLFNTLVYQRRQGRSLKGLVNYAIIVTKSN